jgi:L-asparagine transporter-like permease
LSYGLIGVIAAVLIFMAFTPDQRTQIALSSLSVLVIGGCFALRRRLRRGGAY